MTKPTPQPQPHRKPGRSFEDPSKALGEELLARSNPNTLQPPEDFARREVQAATLQHGVAERAKAIAVLRKADELIETENLPVHQATPRRALELAAGRVGLTIEEYNALTKDDAELLELEREVLANAEAKLGRH
jgi:hypothetical protein